MFSVILFRMNECMLFLAFFNRLEIFMECYIRGLAHKAAACLIEKYFFKHIQRKRFIAPSHSLILTAKKNNANHGEKLNQG